MELFPFIFMGVGLIGIIFALVALGVGKNSKNSFRGFVCVLSILTILLFVASLEYLCIMTTALGVWGIIRSLLKDSRSRILLAAQIIAFILTVIALATIMLINYVSGQMLGGLIEIYPTVYLVICLVALVSSTITGCVYVRYSYSYEE